MRKLSLVRAIFALAMTMAMAVGILIPLTSQAEAFRCPRTFAGCSFSHFETFGTAGGCCMYDCGEEGLEPGICIDGF